ncbi:DUF6297 family protein [Nonomuraea typhae]|uniref:DUF6297 family protein n=1 Tax=Nonomuraea typhae TaxID=2603600 RepID=UPI0012FA5B76|nr:DUF6297 family protein [Nonomuraea typhae]
MIARDVRGIRALTRARGRASLSDRYSAVFGLAMLGALLAQPVLDAVAAVQGPVRPDRAGAGLALVALVYAAFLWAARTLGPVVLSAADAAWLLLSPLDRRAVLGRSARTLLLVGLVAGAGLGLAALAVTGAPDHLAWRLTGALVLGVSAGTGGMALAVLAQTSDPWDLALRLLIAALVVAAAVLMLVAGAHVLAAVPAPAWSAVPAALAAFLVRLARRALPRIPARRLLSSSARAGHLANAATALDPSLLTWIAEDTHWRGRRLRSKPWPALPGAPARRMPALFVPMWQEVRRLLRWPGRLAVLAGAVALPAMISRAGGGAGLVAVAVLAGGLTAAACAVSGVRWDAGDPAFSRLLALRRRDLLAARAVVPGLLAAAWMAAALAILPGLPAALLWFAPPAAPALAAAALRMARRAPVDHAMPVLNTAGGAIPTGPLIWGLTGLDLALAGTWPAAYALAAQPADLRTALILQAVAGAGVLAGYLTRTSNR